MTLSVTSVAVMMCFATSVALCSEDPATERKLQKAKNAFLEESQSARADMVASLEKKKADAVKKGDLARVKQIIAQTKEFSKESKLPSVVPTHAYVVKMRSAVKDVLSAYTEAIRSYTMQENLERASELQKEAAIVQASGTIDSRRVFRYADGEFTFQADGRWVESIADGRSFYYSEVTRTSEFVELKGEASPITLRFYSNRSTIKPPKSPTFRPFKSGKWIRQHGK